MHPVMSAPQWSPVFLPPHPLHNVQFIWSQKCQKSHISSLYNTDTSVKRTLGSVPSLSVLKNFDCSLLFQGLMAAICIIGVSVIVGCPQGQSLLYGKSDFYKGIFSLIVDLFYSECFHAFTHVNNMKFEMKGSAQPPLSMIFLYRFPLFAFRTML